MLVCLLKHDCDKVKDIDSAVGKTQPYIVCVAF